MVQATNMRRSTRQRRPVQRLIEVMCTELSKQEDVPGEIFSMQAMFPDDPESMGPIMAFKAKVDPDTLYLHEAMKQPDWDLFSVAVDLEIEQQVKWVSIQLYTDPKFQREQLSSLRCGNYVAKEMSKLEK